jgi:response regulator RpfG family c-di-GMP phosphodiesterase
MSQLAVKTVRPTKFPTIRTVQLSPVRELFEELLDASLILVEDWEQVPKAERDEAQSCENSDQFLTRLVELGVLTAFQAERVRSGRTSDLILGNYRVLDHMGTGGMGIVYRAEHLLMRRQVAIKVLEPSRSQDYRVLSRFLSEMRVVAQLNHPNIVAALDSGKLLSADPGALPLYYLVMEHVSGEDLESYVINHGPLAPSFACDVVFQIAAALGEAHKHRLVHRDLKPSNIMLTHENQAKLLDFGLVHHLRSNLTAPRLTLGTVDYMAPEQISNASGVDIRADIYALGGTLFWCLTGRSPFVATGGFSEALLQRLTMPAPSVRSLRPDLPAELEAVVARMMAHDPADRYQTPQILSIALAPFLRLDFHQERKATVAEDPRECAAPGTAAPARVPRILVVDDEGAIRDLCCRMLKAEGIACDQAANGKEALKKVQAHHYDMILVDVDMPVMNGPTFCKLVREDPPFANLKIIMCSGRATAEEMAKMLLAGADDYVTKPFSLSQLQARVQAMLRLKAAQDRADMLNQQLVVVNQDLHNALERRSDEQNRSRDALVLALAQCVEDRDGETAHHLVRLQRYCTCLAGEAAKDPLFAGQITNEFVEMLRCCVPLHDLGKIRLSDSILLKPDKLTSEERILVEAHTVIGADTLQDMSRQHGTPLAFMQMASAIARHHHERFDGQGYPDRLHGLAIPLEARIVAVADVYDALRSRRVYKPALSHAAAKQLILNNAGTQFDPNLISAFEKCAGEFEEIFTELPD